MCMSNQHKKRDQTDSNAQMKKIQMSRFNQENDMREEEEDVTYKQNKNG